ncbi:MAG TPA: hypothetical protein DEG92_01075 [Rikenellaceae bacterium]|nr:hypothetical protein [Rikenellaceae bacterium]
MFMRFLKGNNFSMANVLLGLPIIFFVFISFREPIGMGLYFGNDFPEHRIWWMQVKAFYIANGMIPVWNPLDDFGVIYCGWLGFSLFYPLNWWMYLPYYFGTYNYVFEYLQIALHMALALSGIYYLLRKTTEVSVPAAVLSATVFMFNQRFVDSIRYPHTVETIAWSPWIIYFLVKTIECYNENDKIAGISTYRDWLFLILVTLMSWLAGYGQYTYITLLFSGIVLLCLTRKIRSLIAGLSGLGIGSILAAGVLLPTVVQNYGSSTRGGNNIDFASSNQIGSYLDMFFTPFAVDVHASSYFPIIFLVFFISGIAVCFKNGLSRIKVGMLLGVIVIGDLSLGNDGLLFKFFYNHVPFYHSFRLQGRNNWITLIPICYFCAFGMERFVQGSFKYKVGMTALTALLLAICLYKNMNIDVTGSQFSPFSLGWLSIEDASHTLLVLTIISSFAAILMLMTYNNNRIIATLGIVLLCFVFVKYYAVYCTWFDMKMNDRAIWKVTDFYSGGIFVPFKRGSNSRLSFPILVQYFSKNPNADAYEAVVKGAQASPGTRFAFSPIDTNKTNFNVQLMVDHFSPNKIAFTVRTPEPGTLLFFSSFSPLWRSNIEFRKGEGKFSKFTTFSVPAGEIRIKMTFRPIIFVVAGVMSIFGIFSLLAGIGFAYSKKSFSIFLLIIGGSLCLLYVLGVYSPKSFTQTQLFGNSQKENWKMVEIINQKI